MAVTIGIRRENKNEWERRVPLLPADLAELEKLYPMEFLVQPSTIRVYKDEEFREAGITVQEDLSKASIVFAIKEIPIAHLRRDRIYVFFSHVIKGQSYNMPMLRRMMELGCSLVDYEKILDENGRRLIFFGVHAGYAGMIETICCLGRRLKARGTVTPLAEVKHAYEYGTLEKAEEHLREIGKRIDGGELDESLCPLVFGIAGYGNVSRGCQEILGCLPVMEVSPAELSNAAARIGAASPPILKVVFKEENLVRPASPGATFDLQDYYDHPEKYVGCFEDYLPHLDVLLNTTYWDERYPRFVTKKWVKEHYGADRRARLEVIGDISCDIGGAIEVTLQATTPDAPSYTYEPDTDSLRWGCDGAGPAIMAVDNLPCELPREASTYFSRMLRGMVAPLAQADWKTDFAELNLPEALKGAVILHNGELTPPYRYLEQYLAS